MVIRNRLSNSSIIRLLFLLFAVTLSLAVSWYLNNILGVEIREKSLPSVPLPEQTGQLSPSGTTRVDSILVPPGARGFISKPFEVGEMLRVVRTVLGETS